MMDYRELRKLKAQLIEKENKTDRERNDPVTKNRFMGKHKAIFVIEESTKNYIDFCGDV